MNISHVIINSLDEVDFDGIYDGSLDSVEKNWPSDSPLQGEQIKTHIRNMIQSALDNEWPGLNVHSQSDTHILFKHITADGVLEGRHSFSRAESNGSRNYLYLPATVESRNQFYRDIGITKIKYNNLPEASHLYKFLKYKAGSGNYDIVEDFETPGMPGFRTVITAPRL
jgi:hypothetical protein